jgi:hypothetical protein
VTPQRLSPRRQHRNRSILADLHFSRGNVGNETVEANLDAEIFELRLRALGQILSKRTEHAIGTFEQDHASLACVDRLEVFRERLPCDVCDSTRKLDSGRSASDYYEIQFLFRTLEICIAFGQLERE